MVIYPDLATFHILQHAVHDSKAYSKEQTLDPLTSETAIVSPRSLICESLDYHHLDLVEYGSTVV